VDEMAHFLSTYSCPLNYDIEHFLRNTAITFAQQGIAQTHLITDTEVLGSESLVGFFTLTLKTLDVPHRFISRRLSKRISKFGVLSQDDTYSIPMPLIAQLGKNFSAKVPNPIMGDELLELACKKVKAIQREISGKIVYIECDDKPPLIDFYIRNGFTRISDANQANDELVQMIRYLD
jgi:hypothetical protein